VPLAFYKSIPKIKPDQIFTNFTKNMCSRLFTTQDASKYKNEFQDKFKGILKDLNVYGAFKIFKTLHALLQFM